ncbi:MAG: helix-turn-helix transcriptional regulator, partial [Clostridia bacterium]|nr:helix-turn-helix transcriptional regulator [Clostridia bacterium]
MQFDINTVNPYIRVAMQSVLSEGSEIKQRIIFDYELIYIEKGEWLLNYGGTEYICKEGQFLLLRPGIPHSIRVIKEVLQPHIHFDIIYSDKSPLIPVSFKDMPQLTPEEKGFISSDLFNGYPLCPFITFKNRFEAFKLFYGIVNSQPVMSLTSKAMLTMLTELIVRENFPEMFTQLSNPYNVAQQIRDFLDSGQGLSLQLKDFERRFSYSKYHLEREFKKQFGISLMAYRNTKRMEQAKKLLEKQSVSAVSDNLGFSSI